MLIRMRNFNNVQCSIHSSGQVYFKKKIKCPVPDITCMSVMFNSIINDTKVTNVNFHLIAHSAVGHSTLDTAGNMGHDDNQCWPAMIHIMAREIASFDQT